ncbi:hypothetical protein [Pseudomonas sp. Au-Pse12]|uniref:hypothetical protein n=1 Tax=Pseudomonas sp. Au-Pse12 TaxID=2906459 RepID=UPI001E632F33|nr:hypothetical protein [Pseudomonas sp. Au-Pse12]MCE4056897.1 hypothetical protein [Pseudomonas sp. Au-Pse12]
MPEHQPSLRPTRPEVLQAVASPLGKRLRALTHLQYFYNGQADTDDCGNLQWDCEDGSQVGMFLLSDGESVGADRCAMPVPSGFDLAPDARCEWQARDLLLNLDASHLRDATIVRLQGLIDTWPTLGATTLSGFRICFDSGDFLVYYNRGDEAVALLNRLPPDKDDIVSHWQDVSCVR